MNIKEMVELIKFQEKCTQRDIAKTIGMADSNLSSAIKGERIPVKLIKKLLSAYPYLKNEVDKEKENSFKTESVDEREKLINLLTTQQELIMKLQNVIQEKDNIINTLMNNK